MARELARAKLNLYLEIVGKRPDGYHELRTLFQTVDLADDVELTLVDEPGVRLSLTTEGPPSSAEIPTDERNLAARAAIEWLAATKTRGGVAIVLTKRIPAGGGLGGGSSDAAATLRALERTRERPGEDARGTLDAIARRLGADVPFLLEGGLAEAAGRGDVVTTLPPPPSVAFVLILPPFGTETAKVYAHADERRLRPAPTDGLARAKAAVSSGDPARIRDAHHNDLAQPAMRAYPELLRFTSSTERLLGRAPCMTGSGSTLFDVPDLGAVEDVVARLASLPGRRIVVRGIGGEPAPR